MRGTALEGRTLKNILGTGVSRALGFVRDMVLAARVGTGPVMDAWSWAFGTVAVIRRALAETAFDGAALPVLAGVAKDRPEHKRTSGAAVLAVGLAALPALLAIILFAPWLVATFAPGWAGDPHLAGMATRALRGLSWFLSGMVASAWLGTTLRSQGRMAAAALAPAIFNLIVISFVVVDWAGPVSSRDPLGALLAGAGWGAWAMAAAQAGALAYTGRLPVFVRGHPAFAKILSRLPALLGIVAAESVLFLVNRAYATTAGEAAVSRVYYAQRLFQLPLGLLGVGVATAAYPAIAAALQHNKPGEAAASLRAALRLLAVGAIPLLLVLGLHPHTLVEALFERGAFGADDTAATAALLALFALTVPVESAGILLTRAWYALDKGKALLRVRITQGIVGVGVVSAAFLTPILPEPLWGIPIAGLAASLTGLILLRRDLPPLMRAAATMPTGLGRSWLAALLLVGGASWLGQGTSLYTRLALLAGSGGIWLILAWRGRWWR